MLLPILKSSEELSKKVVCEEWFESAQGTKLHPSSSAFFIIGGLFESLTDVSVTF